MSEMRVVGHVDAFLVSRSGLVEQVVDGANTLLFNCADAVAGMFGGLPGCSPASIGFIYGDSGDLGANFNFTAGDRTSRGQDVIVGTGLSVHDRPIDNNVVFGASGSCYAGNSVTFSASRPGQDGKSYVYGALLKDGHGRVIAVKKFDACVVQNPSYAMSLSWTVTFI